MTATLKTKPKSASEEKFPLQFRLPQIGKVDPWFGLNRSAWNTLILPTNFNSFSPPVKSISMRQGKRKRGIRIVMFDSAKAYFDKLKAEQLNERGAA